MRGHGDVVGFQVAVNDVVVMEVGERGKHLESIKRHKQIRHMKRRGRTSIMIFLMIDG